ncbi:MAG TPA: DUF3616 domain-containing protein [Gemmatimonadaceae bacterium]|nr:DUF3616 domain-containing protein [Gemmatimonadaceae bacterium]
MRRHALVAAMVAITSAAATAGCGHRAPALTADSTTSLPIAGGRFEASGVAHVPGSNLVLFVDDGRPRELFAMELTAAGAQAGGARPVALGAHVTDMEGITFDGRHFYVVGSQSKRTGFEGDGLVRFTFDAATGRVAAVERIQGLKAWLAENVAELRGTARRIGDHVLNIEAIAWDPARRRLLLGLRAPVVDGQALVIPIALADTSGPFTRENLRVDGPTLRVALGGAGIRSLEYDSAAGAFALLSGASLDSENIDFRLMQWDGASGSAVRELATFDRRLKPEGITRADTAGAGVRVLVFDVGRFQVLR